MLGTAIGVLAGFFRRLDGPLITVDEQLDALWAIVQLTWRDGSLDAADALDALDQLP